MGTRSLTFIYDNYGLKDGEAKPITCIYVQYDGYLEGVGTELADLLVNKYQKNNGMGCLAGLIICGLKNNEPYNVYIHAPDLDQDAWQEYEYHIYKDKIKALKVGYNTKHTLFEGTYLDFYNHCQDLKKLRRVA